MINYTYCFISFIGILSSLLILGSLNPISRLALLIMVFLMASFQFLILDYYFLGLTYIIVYVGAIAILFLFVIMLIQTDMVGANVVGENIATPNSLISGIKTSPRSKIGALGSFNVKLGFFAVGVALVTIVLSLPFNSASSAIFCSSTFFYPAWSTDLFTLTDIQALGFTLYLGYPVAIVILGIILWIVLIGILTLSSQFN